MADEEISKFDLGDTEGSLLALLDIGVNLEYSGLDPITTARCCLAISTAIKSDINDIAKQPQCSPEDQMRLSKASANLARLERFLNESLDDGAESLSGSKAWSSSEFIVGFVITVARHLEAVGLAHGVRESGYWDDEEVERVRGRTRSVVLEATPIEGATR